MIKLFAIFITNVWAHCPVSFKPEKVCLMLDQNTLFIYDHKLEHNGPYKDFSNSKLVAFTLKGKELAHKKVARGVYKIESNTELPSVTVILENNKIKNTIIVSK